MTRRTHARLGSARGQASLMMLAVIAVVLAGGLLLFAFGNALGAKGKHQRAADLAAISAAQVMRDRYPRLFEPPFLEPGVPNPRHLEEPAYRAAAVAAAVRGGRRNGVEVRPEDVSFGGSTFGATRVTVRVRGEEQVRIGTRRSAHRIRIRGRATAELSPAPGDAFPGRATGGGYRGPLAYRQGEPMRPDVALAFDRMAAAARDDGLFLAVTSGFRSDAEQARLFAAHPDPKWVAPPGESLHRYATELDLGPPAAYGWLAGKAPRFGFVQRYSWEPWHWGFTRGVGSSSVGFGAPGGDGTATRAVQSFVPSRYASLIVRAAQRWSVSAQLLAAQLYAESGFNPFARSPAGAQGIAQFMPGTAAAMGLADPFDPDAAINAQAHLMRDLLGRFGSVPLALAAYNAGPGAVAGCGCVPPIPETTAYVARILGLLGGAGDAAAAAALEVRLVG
ncbi:MAG TPA: transglycosylase SLT domain-containing protein [Thermoleophilaceae bacterium]|nr:transglycosylase SLT domain-containing protein [Thermoleophilaceae bacterium]